MVCVNEATGYDVRILDEPRLFFMSSYLRAMQPHFLYSLYSIAVACSKMMVEKREVTCNGDTGKADQG